jgi:hypothetical protein
MKAPSEHGERLRLGNLLKEELAFSVRMFFAPLLGIARELRRQIDYVRHLVAQSAKGQPSLH